MVYETVQNHLSSRLTSGPKLECLCLLNIPLWVPKKPILAVQSHIQRFELQGPVQLYSWLIYLDQPYDMSSQAQILLEQILWSIGVTRAQFVCATLMQNQAGAGLSHHELVQSIHPAFIMSWGLFQYEASPFHLAFSWTLQACLDQPLLKQQVMYDLYQFMHLSEA